LLPALLLDKRSWGLVLSRLSVDVEVDFFDLPPDLGAVDPEAALSAYEAALMARVERERGRRVIVAGNSLGGYLAARILSHVGSAVTHCVALAGLARLPDEQIRARSGLADQVERGDLAIADVVALLRQTSLGSAPIEAEARRLLDEMLAPLTRDGLVRALHLTTPLARPEWTVAPFTTPMTLMHGREDQNVSFVYSEELARLGSDTKLVALDTSSHLLPLSHPAEVAELLQTILVASSTRP
jgi:pimeloyl-ACP methyl ester carboxylesterase